MPSLDALKFDWAYLNSLASFGVGLLAGLQGISGVYGKNLVRASRTGPGLSYLVIRGVVPGALFLSLYGAGKVEQPLLLWAIALGAGVELVLRSTFFVGQAQGTAGSIDSLLKGPFDLLRWFQNLFLESIDDSLARAKIAFVDTHLPPGVAFPALWTRAMNHANAFQVQQTAGALTALLQQIKAEYDAELAQGVPPADIDLKHREKLGLLVLNRAGEGGFRTLLS